MNSNVLHPALRQLMRFQTRAKLRMFVRRLRSPRRIILSVIALVLGFVWLGQTVLGMLFRAPANPENLRVWIPVGMTTYALWHVLKTATQKPIEPFEWTPTEKEMLIAGPLSRRQLVSFRLACVVRAAVLKALCFSLVMLPDLRIWPLGLFGMLLALTFLDLLRVTCEVVAWGVTTQTFKKIRLAVVSIAIAIGISGLAGTLLSVEPAQGNLFFGLMMRFVAAVVELRTTWPGQIASLPFETFSQIVLADRWSLGLLAHLVVACGLISAAAIGLIRLDKWFLTRREQRERRDFGTHLAAAVRSNESSIADRESRAVLVPRRWQGAGTLAWRQMLGVFHYPSSVLISMLLPGALSLMPLAIEATDRAILVQIVGSLVFYSFLLMPAALRFDFRRDVDRLGVLRALPISPWATTLGQLAVPVLVCTVFQFIVLCVAMAIRPFPVTWLLVSALILIPVNAVIFSLENLIFLLFPYRPNQEGVGIFLRTILTFTAKGLIFTLAVLATLIWMFGARGIIGLMGESASAWTPVLFMGGIWAMTCLAAAGLCLLIARAYRKFDPSQDTPAMS